MNDYQAFNTIQAIDWDLGALLGHNYWTTAPSNFLEREKQLSRTAQNPKREMRQIKN